MGSNGVTVTKFLQLLMIVQLYLELSYFLSQIYTVETAFKVYVCPRGNLLYMRIYLITDLKLL